MKRLHDPEIALAGRGGVMAAHELVVQTLQQLGHRQYLQSGFLANTSRTACVALARALLLPGLGLQRLTTREPGLEETHVALRAVESVLRRECNL